MTQKILITGGAGYIGSALCQYLLENPENEIDVIDNFYYDNFNTLNSCLQNQNLGRIKIHNIDVRNINACRRLYKKADVIVPLAAIVGAKPCDEDPTSAININFGSIQAMIKELSAHQLVVFPNTNSGYGTVDRVCTEETPMNPISVYGTTKQQAEKVVLDHNESIVFRLATVFGVSPRMRWDLLVNNFVIQAVRNNKLEIFEGDYWRNFIHIEDICYTFAKAIDHEIDSGVYNLGNDDINMTKMELANCIKMFMPDNFVVSVKTGKDPDQRNYKVSSKKLREQRVKILVPLEIGIAQILNLAYLYKDMNELMFKCITARNRNY